MPVFSGPAASAKKGADIMRLLLQRTCDLMGYMHYNAVLLA